MPHLMLTSALLSPLALVRRHRPLASNCRDVMLNELRGPKRIFGIPRRPNGNGLAEDSA